MIGRGWGFRTAGKGVVQGGVDRGVSDRGPEQFGCQGEKRERATRAAERDQEHGAGGGPGALRQAIREDGA
jgi:hypothetical protein